MLWFCDNSVIFDNFFLSSLWGQFVRALWNNHLEHTLSNLHWKVYLMRNCTNIVRICMDKSVVLNYMLINIEYTCKPFSQLWNCRSRMMASVEWLLSLVSLSTSNFCCVALCSFFSTTLPSQRTLLFFFHTLLVLSLTGLVNIMVRTRWEICVKLWGSEEEKTNTCFLSRAVSNVLKKLKCHQGFWLLTCFGV